MTSLRSGLLAAATGLLVCGRAANVRADGAFPDSLQILLPSDRAQELVLSTTFGLILSDDAGASWTWTCEQASNSGATLYSVSAPAADRIFGVAPEGLAHSDDGGCSWTLADGLPAGNLVTDAFPDPTDAQRVWTIVSAPGSATVPDQVFLSQDGGATLGASVYQAPLGATLTGIESARSDPKTVYAAVSVPIAAADYPVQHPMLARSSDGGKTWDTLDVEPGLGPNQFRIMAVDPADAQRLYLRVFDVLADAVAVTDDGGATVKMPITLDSGGAITAFARLASGTVLVAGLVATTPVGFRSTDGGTTFADWTGVPFLRALGERGGRLYGATDNLYQSDWALGVSADEGTTFQPMMAYGQVKGVKPCAAASCRDVCQSEVAAQVWASSVCSPGIDGGPTADGAARFDGASGDGFAADGTDGDGGGHPEVAACGCGAAGSTSNGGLQSGVPFAVLTVTLVRRRGGRSSRRKPPVRTFFAWAGAARGRIKIA